MLRSRLMAFVFGWLVVAPVAAAQDFDVPVDVELVLAVDVSGSMDAHEQRVQRAGYVAALGHADFIAAVQRGSFGRIALTYVEWAGPGRLRELVPWTAIADEEDTALVAEVLAAASITRMRGTSISGALDHALTLFDGNGFEGTRRVIDISGDGPNNMGGPVEPARDRVLEAGITINGLPLMLRPSLRASSATPGLDDYFRDCVIGGPGAFVLPVHDIDEVVEAIRRKLVLDIAGLPEGEGTVHRVQAAPPVDCGIGERLRRNWMEP